MFSSTRAEQRQMVAKTQRARNECILMWNGGKNWSNRLKKILEKGEGNNDKFRDITVLGVHFAKSVRGSVWAWMCVPSFKKTLSYFSCYHFQETKDSLTQIIVVKIINKLILIDGSWQVNSQQQHTHQVITFIVHYEHVCVCCFVHFSVYICVQCMCINSTFCSAHRGDLLKECEIDWSAIDGQNGSIRTPQCQLLISGSIMLIAAWDSLFIGT